ncbi:MAG: AAA family ATPase [Caldilineaceae bacterium]|nr:AAA family ATPase [Caldilineaceae bacterium]
MPHLSLSVLGSLTATLDGRPLTGLESNKVRALLVYLALEADRPHLRTLLASLLWPNHSDTAALANLRYALANLRAQLGDRTAAQTPHLLVTRTTLQFNRASDYWIDAAAFLALTQAAPGAVPDVARLEESVAIYRAEFLEGFALDDAAPFEEWALVKREQLARRLGTALQQLADVHEQQGDFAQAEVYARRLVASEPYLEETHRQLMRILAFSGQRSAALAQYDTCCALLARELGVAPSQSTTRLYTAIREERLTPEPPAPSKPPALPPRFVGRTQELDRLDRCLQQARAGQGQILLIAGTPGSGKSALAAAFVRRALQRQDVIAAWGSANAYTGIGDPYLPFRQILQMLTGDLDSQRAAELLSPRLAQRLWEAAPAAIQLLVEAAPDLIGRFVPGTALLERALAAADARPGRLARLEQRLAQQPDVGNPSTWTEVRQTDLFDQTAKLLLALARHRPLLLVVDDLQWADPGSLSLLFHIGRRLDTGRILLLGAYRPEELLPDADGRPHPLELIVGEFRRTYGDIVLNLDQSPGRLFVDALLDAEPNQLGTDFRRRLVQHTDGHALFTVELLRGLQERGDLMRDQAGRWSEAPDVIWNALPARVDAAVADRLHRLPPEWQEMLRVASVEGEQFTAEVVARVLGLPVATVVQVLSHELSKHHPLVLAEGTQWTGTSRLSQYRFRHFLFQKHLYQTLDLVERPHLHAAVGEALEASAGDQTETLAAALARHFEMAGLPEKAAHYLLAAGNHAARLLAHDMALTHLRHGLALLAALPATPARAKLELQLRLALGAPLLARRSYIHEEVAENYRRAQALARTAGDSVELFHALAGLKSYHDLRLDLDLARALGEECMRIAQGLGDPALQALAAFKLGGAHSYRGDLALALPALRPLQELDDAPWQQAMRQVYGYDQQVAALGIGAIVLCMMGYPDQAETMSARALALAEAIDHPFSLAHARFHAAMLRQYRLEPVQAQRLAEATITVAQANAMAMWLGGGMTILGWALAAQGDPDAAIPLLEETQERLIALHMKIGQMQALRTLAEVYAQVGRTDEALALLAEAERCTAATGFLQEAPEVYRLQGDVLLQQGAPQDQVEACYRRAIATAQHMQAKLWELRAGVSLCRLWQQRGEIDAAYRRLEPVYRWFGEGLQTPDLRAACRLLDELRR